LEPSLLASARVCGPPLRRPHAIVESTRHRDIPHSRPSHNGQHRPHQLHDTPQGPIDQAEPPIWPTPSLTWLEWCSGERRKGIWALQVSTDVYGENRGCEGGIGARKEEGIHVPRRTARGQGGASIRGRVDVGREMRKTLASRFSVAARERINEEAAIGVLIPPFPPRNQLQIATDSRQRRSSRRGLLELLQGADSGKEADLASGSGVAVKAHACKRWRAPQRGCR
jgi:hypothetical protein